VFRAVLERQLCFRREQLAGLGAPGVASSGGQLPDGGAHEAALALREVDVMVAAGAQRALDDISVALEQMNTGRYGCCRSCGDRIPLAVLEAIPKTTLCLACQIRCERTG
jgi:DnaK suppressor protein